MEPVVLLCKNSSIVRGRELFILVRRAREEKEGQGVPLSIQVSFVGLVVCAQLAHGPVVIECDVVGTSACAS